MELANGKQQRFCVFWSFLWRWYFYNEPVFRTICWLWSYIERVKGNFSRCVMLTMIEQWTHNDRVCNRSRKCLTSKSVSLTTFIKCQCQPFISFIKIVKIVDVNASYLTSSQIVWYAMSNEKKTVFTLMSDVVVVYFMHICLTWKSSTKKCRSKNVKWQITWHCLICMFEERETIKSNEAVTSTKSVVFDDVNAVYVQLFTKISHTFISVILSNRTIMNII